jgi:hypothetical protein
LQELASNRPVLLRSKGVVVNDRGKGIGKMSGEYRGDELSVVNYAPVDVRGLPPFRDETAEGWGTQVGGEIKRKQRKGGPPARAAALNSERKTQGRTPLRCPPLCRRFGFSR